VPILTVAKDVAPIVALAKDELPISSLHSAIKDNVHDKLQTHVAKHEFLKQSFEHIANIQPDHKPSKKEIKES
jgi:hypothetical protein